MSGARDDRPGLGELMAYVRNGDTVVAWKLDRPGGQSQLKPLQIKRLSWQPRPSRAPVALMKGVRDRGCIGSRSLPISHYSEHPLWYTTNSARRTD